MRNQPQRTKKKKAAGPDDISSKIIKSCFFFLFFSSTAFNATKLGLMRDTMEPTEMDHYLIHWIMHHLTSRTQYVAIWDCLSAAQKGPTGNSSGTVPLHPHTPPVTYISSPIHAIINLIIDVGEKEYRGLMQD